MSKEPFDLKRFMAGEPAETRGGEIAHFVAYVSEAAECSRLVYRVGDCVRVAYDSGRLDCYVEHCADLLYMLSPYADFKIDEKMMFSDNGDTWVEGHWAGIKNGDPAAWHEGATSWTTSRRTSWNYARRPTKEELEGER